jgi:hypothetical protein
MVASEIMTKIGEALDDFRLDVQRVLACGDVAVTQLRYSGPLAGGPWCGYESLACQAFMNCYGGALVTAS